MPKLAIVATIKTAPGKRDEYLEHLKAHAERCRAQEPGTLQFEVLVPQKEADTVMLYEVYASLEAFQLHWNGESMKQVRRDTENLQLTLSGVRCDLVE
jgi:quinol monooxygenase YgiN